MEQLHISNSMLHDWEDLCPLIFQARWIDKTLAWPETVPMRWGNIFETLAIGKGVQGKAAVPTEAEKKSINYERVKKQAQDCRDFLKNRGGKVISYQKYEYAEVVDSQGQTIPIMGGFDIEYMFSEPDEEPKRGVIDLKLTGDTDNTFGKFAWGKPESMDVSQAIHYGLIQQYLYGDWPRFEYWVFDSSVAMKKTMINVNISDYMISEHIERVSRAYNEIITAIDFLGFQPVNTYSNCNKCPLRHECRHRRTMPEIIEIYK